MLEEKTMPELVEYYNKLTRQKVKTFPDKETAIKKIQEQETLYSNNPIKYNWDDAKEEKYFSPKQLEVILNMKATVIRKKLRKLFPEEAKHGSWNITQAMVDKIKGESHE